MAPRCSRRSCSKALGLPFLKSRFSHDFEPASYRFRLLKLSWIGNINSIEGRHKATDTMKDSSVVIFIFSLFVHLAHGLSLPKPFPWLKERPKIGKRAIGTLVPIKCDATDPMTDPETVGDFPLHVQLYTLGSRCRRDAGLGAWQCLAGAGGTDKPNGQTGPRLTNGTCAEHEICIDGVHHPSFQDPIAYCQSHESIARIATILSEKTAQDYKEKGWEFPLPPPPANKPRRQNYGTQTILALGHDEAVSDVPAPAEHIELSIYRTGAGVGDSQLVNSEQDDTSANVTIGALDANSKSGTGKLTCPNPLPRDGITIFESVWWWGNVEKVMKRN